MCQTQQLSGWQTAMFILYHAVTTAQTTSGLSNPSHLSWSGIDSHMLRHHLAVSRVVRTPQRLQKDAQISNH